MRERYKDIMKILCNDCEHAKVCRHRESYLQTIENLDMKIETPFSVTLDCPFHKTKDLSWQTINDYNAYLTSTNNITTNTSTSSKSLTLDRTAFEE